LILGDGQCRGWFFHWRKKIISGSIPAGPPLGKFADRTEPQQVEERRGSGCEKNSASLPAMAVGYVMPPRRTPDLVPAGSASIKLCTAGAPVAVYLRNWFSKITDRRGSRPAVVDDIFGYARPIATMTPRAFFTSREISSEDTLAGFDQTRSP